MAIGALAGIGGILVFKEVADFIQIGLVSWQTGKRFSGSRTAGGRTYNIDGGSMRIQGEGFSIELPLDDAARAAGVAGVAGKGTAAQRAAWESAASPLNVAKRAASSVTAAFATNRAVPHKPTGAGDRGTVASAPNPDDKPFTAREFFAMQQRAAQVGGEKKTQRELQLEKMREAHALQLARITDATKRAELAAEFSIAERKLEQEVLLAREQQAADAASLERKFALQRGLDDAERVFKGTQAEADRQWRERTQREMAEIGFYQKNLAADLAVDRAVGAARKITEVLTSPTLRGLSKAAVPVSQITTFASRFAGGG